MTDTDYEGALALIGMSGRFPGAGSVGALWQNLLDGVPGLRAITDEELAAAGVPASRLADPQYVRVGGPLEGIEGFDAGLFGFSPREAETMEPQHRLFLECSFEALESAGYCPTEIPGQVAVFGGAGFPHYMMSNVRHVADEPGGDLLLGVGNERDSLANLVSYKLGLRGPSLTVQTFCSTSLVAVHLACQSLLTYECDVALAGGAYIPLPQPTGYQYEEGGIVSPDGRVRSFDAAANGTVMGSGVGVVVLKRMSEALADGDVIHAVVLGSSANNDGRVRAGYTAPGVDGQAAVMASAFDVAGVKPDTIGYLECHATGTVLGDSIELAAMSRVFPPSPQTPCVLGSLKPSLGHLDRASGVAGLMRAALSLRHEILPGTPGYTTPNPALAAADDRFTVLPEHRAWPRGAHPRRAGVSSFGLGGTNAHVVLEQAPARPARPARPGPFLLTFSAADPTALAEVTDRLRSYLVATPDADLADVAFTLQMSRGGFALRRAVVCTDREDAIAALADPARRLDGETRRRHPGYRLRGGDDVPAAWWSDLHAAVTALLLPDAEGAPDRDGTLAALGLGLARVGIGVGADPGRAGAEELLVGPGDEGGGDRSAAPWLLTVLARAWMAGATVDWSAVDGGHGRRVELPTYPFQRRRYWVDAAPERPAGATASPTDRTDDPAGWTYLPTWAPHPVPLADLDERLRLAGPWLVLSGDDRSEAVVDRLHEAGAEVTAVRPGPEFGQDDAADFVVATHDDLAEVLALLPVVPRTVVHGFSLASPVGPVTGEAAIAHFDAEQERGLWSVLALARGLVDDTGEAPPLDLVLLTSGATSVAGADLLHPEHATLAAVGPTLAQENPRLQCRQVDLGAGVDDDADQTAAILAAVLAPHEGPVAIRAGEAWRRRYELHPLAAGTRAFRPDDTVLITGGLGDVGLTLARHLAGTHGCRLVLTARSPIPPREEWAAFLAAVPEGGERTARHLRNVMDLEERGADVLAVSAEVADRAGMQAVVDAAVRRFGGIDVVVHGAGVQDERFFGFAHLTGREAAEAHLDAKVRGFLVLEDVLAGHCPDRRITLSSLAAVLGGMTLGAYAAANAGLDAYARAARVAGSGRWTTVDWDTWDIDPERTHGGTVAGFAMAGAEGVEVFERALAAGDRIGRLVVSTGSLDARVAQWVLGSRDAEAGTADDVRERYPRPDLAVPYEQPREGTETALAAIWADVLGIDPVGALDNFFELGGHSLVAIKLTTRIRRALQASIPVTALLEAPTLRQLAALIDEGNQP